ncbi:MAG: nicotinamide riboside transporter PnuC [Flavobacterium sp.]|jgi:nicotinamide mononucleotide transporter
MWDFLFQAYEGYDQFSVTLEIVAFLFGVFSVYLAKQNHILVYPTGIISTSIYVYLLWQWSLLGDMLVNGYYTILSILGWYWWMQKKGKELEFPIQHASRTEWVNYGLFFSITIVFIVLVYLFFDKFTNWYSYVDTFTTGLFMVAMLAMAKRKIEHWIFWIIGNVLSIPLYFLKGYTITSIQYLVFLILAIAGYIQWKKFLNKSTTNS